MKDRIRQLLRFSPFRPFIIRMADGTEHYIDNPEFVLAGSDHPHVIVEERDGTVHYLSVLLMTSATHLLAAQDKAA